MSRLERRKKSITEFSFAFDGVKKDLCVIAF